MPTYYTGKGVHIRNPDAYARTGAPMYQTKSGSTNINKETSIYKLNLQGGKKYIGKSSDVDRRMDQHFSGNGAKVTQKFKPIEGKISCVGRLLETTPETVVTELALYNSANECIGVVSGFTCRPIRKIEHPDYSPVWDD